MHSVIFWFRNDLRLQDQAALQQAVAHAERHGQRLLIVYVHDPAQDDNTAWGFRRMGPHRRRFLAETLHDLSASLQALGQNLVLFQGEPHEVLSTLALRVNASAIYAEEIAAPEEQAQVQGLKEALKQALKEAPKQALTQPMTVHTVWQSSLLAPEALPFAVADMPQIFTTFRQRIEAVGLQPLPPLAAPRTLPPAPDVMPLPDQLPGWRESPWALLGLDDDIAHEVAADLRTEVSTRPLKDDEHSHFKGGESHALAHLHHYLTPPWPDRYKQTRNALQGLHISSHWSPGLATGAVSARTVWAALHAYEQQHGANDGTYWLWFELLWRDNFRFLHLQHGRQLYAARGLSSLPRPKHFPKDFQRWCDGNTGEPIVDAGMRELVSTGYTSNRMRQIVASYLVHDLSCDWRAGAAWFESQLIDYDIYSNQGNWLYISGRGTDPRAGRRFNPTKQTQDHDPQGRYRKQWLGA